MWVPLPHTQTHTRRGSRTPGGAAHSPQEGQPQHIPQPTPAATTPQATTPAATTPPATSKEEQEGYEGGGFEGGGGSKEEGSKDETLQILIPTVKSGSTRI